MYAGTLSKKAWQYQNIFNAVLVVSCSVIARSGLNRHRKKGTEIEYCILKYTLNMSATGLLGKDRFLPKGL